MLREFWEERRKFPRVSFNTSVAYQNKGDNAVTYALTKDLSQTGMCLTLDKFIPKDAELILDFALDNYLGQIRTKARVAWIQRLPYAQQYRAGLEFRETEPLYSLNLKRFLNR
jgi:c-di-GMP-binding flagellar brake protein YcgR